MKFFPKYTSMSWKRRKGKKYLPEKESFERTRGPSEALRGTTNVPHCPYTRG